MTQHLPIRHWLVDLGLRLLAVDQTDTDSVFDTKNNVHTLCKASLLYARQNKT